MKNMMYFKTQSALCINKGKHEYWAHAEPNE